jgi:hypothetical protein
VGTGLVLAPDKAGTPVESGEASDKCYNEIVLKGFEKKTSRNYLNL